LKSFFTYRHLRVLTLIFFCCTFFSGKILVNIHLSKKKFNISGNAASLKNSNHSRDRHKKIFPVKNVQPEKNFSSKTIRLHKKSEQSNNSSLTQHTNYIINFSISRGNNINISYVNISYLKQLRTIKMLL